MNFKQSEMFLLSLNVGEGYNDVVINRRTKKRIYLSNGSIIHIKKCNTFHYLDGKNVKQILRDIEGFLVYKVHC